MAGRERPMPDDAYAYLAAFEAWQRCADRDDLLVADLKDMLLAELLDRRGIVPRRWKRPPPQGV